MFAFEGGRKEPATDGQSGINYVNTWISESSRLLSFGEEITSYIENESGGLTQSFIQFREAFLWDVHGGPTS